MDSQYQTHINKAKSLRKEIKKTFSKLSVKPTAFTDEVIHQKHEEAFKKINCLNCANCCKTTGPRFVKSDIKRIAKFLGVRPIDFEYEYLQVDEDGDFVLKQVPCVFLDENNYCSIYEARPKACAEFPHTDRKNQAEIFSITQKNLKVCPAVAKIFVELSSEIKNK